MDLHRAEQRHQTPGTPIFEGPLRATVLAASPAAAMILRLRLNEMDPQRSKQMLALLQRQPDHLRHKVNQDQPIVARFSPDLLTWSEEVPLFCPNREHAYGVYMHDPAKGDRIHPDLPPSQPGQNNKGWAYGAFLIDRYTTWDAESRQLNLTFLMSPSSPYQVQLMETAVRLPIPIVG